MIFELNKYKRYWVVAAIASWILMVLAVILDQYDMEHALEYIIIPPDLKRFLFNCFVIFTYLYLQSRNDSDTNIDFYNILWSLFFTSATCTFLSVVVSTAMGELEQASHQQDYLKNILYHTELGLFVFFLIHAFLKWKKLILYRRVRWVTGVWSVFETFLLGALLLHFLHIDLLGIIYMPLVGISALLSFVLALSLSWVAFLNFRQKIISLAFLIFVNFSLYYFFRLLDSYSNLSPLDLDLSHSVFMMSFLVFIGIYSVATTLVLLFNLPTSSVFEEKFSSIISYQRFTDSILEGKTPLEIYETLVENAITTFKADAVWLEVKANNIFIYKQIDSEEANRVMNAMQQTGYNNRNVRSYHKKELQHFYQEIPYHSVLVVPFLSHKDELMGSLVLLKFLDNAFDNVMTNLVANYAAQASMALDNFGLISDALENQRYKGEMLTAKKVQSRLLPKLNIKTQDLEVLTYSVSPDLVGGDYYDFYKISENKYALIIGDVSGKGTSAAFYMAQLKGVFHSLVQFDLAPDMFLKFANDALTRCLEKNSFITATYCLLDTENRKVYYSRAGHCPMLYYNSEKQTHTYLEGKGMGLGIVRNAKFEKYIDIQCISYGSGDSILLFTDGVVEAKSKDGLQEYGYEHLKEVMELYQPLEPSDILSRLVQDLDDFTGHEKPQDDTTFVLIKFF